MNADTTFAVVDLETTGTSVKDGDRMIQFGCALVRHGKIIQTISQMINPDPFLNAEFERIGLPKLQLEAIDTVELAQVLLPEISSFRLSDLTTHFAIQHDNPHQADSDATSTAKLLLQLKARFQALPTPTQQALIQRHDGFIRETGDYLKMIASPPRPLKKEFVQVGPLVLRRPMTTPTDLAAAGAYPATAALSLS